MTPDYIYIKKEPVEEGVWSKDDVFRGESTGSVQYVKSDIVAELLDNDPTQSVHLAEIGRLNSVISRLTEQLNSKDWNLAKANVTLKARIAELERRR